jgi:hypothetical protein
MFLFKNINLPRRIIDKTWRRAEGVTLWAVIGPLI